MKKLMSILLVVVLTLALSGVAMAATDTATQGVTVTVDEIAVIDVTGGAITMAVVAPTAGGALPADVTNATAYLQYTCNGADPANATTPTTRKVTVAISAATPATYDFNVVASAPATDLGTAAAAVTLGTVAADLITAIGNANTGIGAADGSNLTYTVTCVTMPAVDAGTVYTVTYTLTAVCLLYTSPSPRD